MKILSFSVLSIILLMSANLFSQTDWKIDQSHSKVGFSVSHMLISEVDGKFTKYDGTVTTTKDDLTDAKINITIDVNSINTDNEKRDAHLKSEDFFNATKFPKISFVSKTIKKTGKDKYKMVGDFTMGGITKQADFEVIYTGSIKDSWGNFRSAYKITGIVNRFDYNLKWNNLLETGGAVVGKEVTITCSVELIKNK